MNRILRLSSLALALVVTIGLMATTMAGVQAEPQTPVAAQAIHTGTTVSGDQDVQPRSTGAARAGDHVKPFGPQIYYMGHDFCGGWLQGPAWCLTFNKIEAGYIRRRVPGHGGRLHLRRHRPDHLRCRRRIAAAIQRYVDRNGVCPKSRPKMRVEYFPRPGEGGVRLTSPAKRALAGGLAPSEPSRPASPWPTARATASVSAWPW